MRLLRKTFLRTAAFALTAILAVLTGCMEYGPAEQEKFDYGPGSGMPQDGVFILHEGRFTYGEASLSYYIPSAKRLENEVFIRANTIRLGDIAQSMVIRGGLAYIAVNNSGVIFVIDVNTFEIRGLVRDIPSPRYIHFHSDSKAYVTSYDDPRIAVFDPRTNKVTSHIDTGNHFSTEQIAAWGDYLFITCWSWDDTVLIVDTRTDEIAGEIRTRIQPRWIAKDSAEKLWVLTDGDYTTSSYGYEIPALYRIDPASRSIEKEFIFNLGDSPKGLALSGDGNTVYFLNKHVYAMPADSDELPSQPVIRNAGNTVFYALGIDPATSDIYVGDAVDYSQKGVVYRYDSAGNRLDAMRTGIIPNSFYFK